MKNKEQMQISCIALQLQNYINVADDQHMFMQFKRQRATLWETQFSKFKTLACNCRPKGIRKECGPVYGMVIKTVNKTVPGM